MLLLDRVMEYRRRVEPCLVFSVIVLATGWILYLEGRVGICACGSLALWAGDIWSAHNSQHLFDPYSFTHVLHGVLFCGLVTWLLRKRLRRWHLVMAVAVEAAWEVLENSPFIIDRYREATFALGYAGDSILNSTGDIMCCAAGFLLARRLGFVRSATLFVVVELVLVYWIRDNLTLNILMLIHPVSAVKAWQLIH